MNEWMNEWMYNVMNDVIKGLKSKFKNIYFISIPLDMV